MVIGRLPAAMVDRLNCNFDYRDTLLRSVDCWARWHPSPLVSQPTVERLVCRSVCLWPGRRITRINNQNHLGHHRHLATTDDPDLHQFTCTNKHHWLLLLGYLTGVTSLWRSFKKVFITAPLAGSKLAPGAARLTPI